MSKVVRICVCVRVAVRVQKRRMGVTLTKDSESKSHQGRHDDAMAMLTHGSHFEISDRGWAAGV